MSDPKVFKSRQKKTSAIIPWRVRFVQLLLSLFLLLIIFRTFQLQVLVPEQFKKSGDQQRRLLSTSPIFRGKIVDSTGNLLAIDTIRFNVYLRPNDYKPKEKEEQKLAEILEIPVQQLREIASKKYISRLATLLEKNKAKQISLLKIRGIEVEPKNHRSYPQGQLAAHILGFMNWDSSSTSGIENFVNNFFKKEREKGNPTPVRGDGRPIYHLSSFKPVIGTALGETIQLTINSKFQYELEEILRKNVERFEPERATAIVISPSTGEILAWANYPSFDPNSYSQYPIGSITDWSITQIYEPGSTFKPLTISAAFETKAIKDDFKFFDEGKLKIGRTTVKNHDYLRRKPSELGLVDILEYSSNTGAAQIAMKMGNKAFYNMLRSFGFGKRTGIELPGESSGSLKPVSKWSNIDLVTTAFGQGVVAVTPLQLASAINVLANNGTLVKLHLIKEIKDASGKRALKKIKIQKKKVLSRSTAKKVSLLLAQSVKAGLDDRTHISGRVNFPVLSKKTEINEKNKKEEKSEGDELEDKPEIPLFVAGKTGTAQKYCPELGRYCPDVVVTSFVGYFPYDKPEYLILVVFDSPKYGRSGDSVAGYTFNQIADELIKDSEGKV